MARRGEQGSSWGWGRWGSRVHVGC